MAVMQQGGETVNSNHGVEGFPKPQILSVGRSLESIALNYVWVTQSFSNPYSQSERGKHFKVFYTVL